MWTYVCVVRNPKFPTTTPTREERQVSDCGNFYFRVFLFKTEVVRYEVYATKKPNISFEGFTRILYTGWGISHSPRVRPFSMDIPPPVTVKTGIQFTQGIFDLDTYTLSQGSGTSLRTRFCGVRVQYINRFGAINKVLSHISSRTMVVTTAFLMEQWRKRARSVKELCGP